MPDGYCRVADVSSETKKAYSENTVPSISDVEGYIDRAYHEINLIVQGLDYPVPVDETESPSSYSIVHSLNILYAAWKATDVPGASQRSNQFMDEYEHKIKYLRDGTIKLQDGMPGEATPPDRNDVQSRGSFPDRADTYFGSENFSF